MSLNQPVRTKIRIHHSVITELCQILPSKRKRKRQCIQLICAEELSEEQPPESYERNLDTVENGRNNEADDTERNSEKQEEEEEEQDINRRIDSKTKATMLYPLKVVEEVIVIESDDE